MGGRIGVLDLKRSRKTDLCCHLTRSVDASPAARDTEHLVGVSLELPSCLIGCLIGKKKKKKKNNKDREGEKYV